MQYLWIGGSEAEMTLHVRLGSFVQLADCRVLFVNMGWRLVSDWVRLAKRAFSLRLPASSSPAATFLTGLKGFTDKANMRTCSG